MPTNIDYIAKDFDSFKSAMIDYAVANYGPGTSANRIWTNYGDDDPNTIWLEIAAFVCDELAYYLDSQVTQAIVTSTTVRAIMFDIAAQLDYEISTATSAEGTATFTVNAAGTIEEGFRLRSDTGVDFYCVNSGGTTVTTGTSTVDVSVIEGLERTDTFTAKGVQEEEFLLTYDGLVVDTTNSDPTLYSPIVTVNGVTATKVTSFVNSEPSDLHYIVDYDRSGRAIIRFGDGALGQILIASDAVVVNYRIGGGSAGNISVGSLTTLVDSNNIISSVTNSAAFSGGNDEPLLESLRAQLPGYIRTLERAVAEGDYGDLVEANFNQVLKSFSEESTEDTEDIKIYVLPSASTITNISDNAALSASIRSYVEDRKATGIVFSLENAYGLAHELEIDIHLNSNASASLVQSTIQSDLEDFFSLTAGDIDEEGTKFAQETYLNDIYNIIDSVAGIQRFEIKKMTYQPRVDEVLGLAAATNYLVSDVEVFSASEESEWITVPIYVASAPYLGELHQKIQGTVTTIAEDYIGDDKLDFTLATGTDTRDTNSAHNEINDNNQTFEIDQFNGELLEDANGNLFVISDTEAHSIITDGAAALNTSVANPVRGAYKVIRNFVGSTVLVRGLVLSPIDYNTENMFYIEDEGFNDLALIGDSFEISTEHDGSVNAVSRVIFGGDPADTDTLVVTTDLGVMTFEFDLGGAITAGNFAVTRGGGAAATRTNLVTSITTYGAAIGIEARAYTESVSGNPAIAIRRTTGGTTATLVVTSTSGSLTELDLLAGYGVFLGYPNSTTNAADNADGTYTLTMNIAPTTYMEAWPEDYVVMATFNSTIEVFEVISCDVNAGTIDILAIDGITAVNMATVVCSITQRCFTQDNRCSFAIGSADTALNTAPTPTIPGVGTTPNEYGYSSDGTKIDNFVFRTSSYTDDITNLRGNEIPTLSTSTSPTTVDNIITSGDLKIKFFGGVS